MSPTSAGPAATAANGAPSAVVFAGAGEPLSYDADERDRIFVDRATVGRLGSVEAILAHFDAADFALPPLVVPEDAKP